MKLQFKLTVSFVLGCGYFALFVIAGQIVRLEFLQIFFLSLFAGFEYVGIEKLLCLETNNNKTFCKASELFLSAVMLPEALYAVLSIADPDLFSPAASVALGTVIYRGVWLVTEPIIKR